MNSTSINWLDEIDRQLGASLDMLQVAIETATERIWDHPNDDPKFWKICVHIVFFVDFYYSTFQPDTSNLEKTYQLPEFLHKYTVSWIEDVEDVISKEDILEYLEYSRNKLRISFDNNITDQFSDSSGFDWLPMNKGELLLYNMRHIMEHTAILNQVLKKHGLPASNWKGISKI